MLKILFGLLLVINGGLLAYQQGYLDTLSPPSREPSRLTQQLNAEKLQLLSTPVQTDADAKAEDEAKPDAKATTVLAAVEPEKTLARADKMSNALVCAEVGNFDASEAKKFEAQLAGLALGERLTRRSIPENVRHMVYIPPQANKEAADKKAGELKRLGVQDFFVIQDSSAMQWGISLGVFKSEEAARNQLAALNQKGVRSARIGTQATGATKVAFQLRGLDATARSSVTKIKEDFPRQELRDCSADAG
ncbi:SPOR domain-containing protein [Herminiimonas aquatilis]|uniref:SPOR domain-containing protein n=1 Tax=Herminiimonas aquatilis TaxID=345342 RepID=A0ABW2J571_9BURK